MALYDAFFSDITPVVFTPNSPRALSPPMSSHKERHGHVRPYRCISRLKRAPTQYGRYSKARVQKRRRFIPLHDPTRCAILLQHAFDIDTVRALQLPPRRGTPACCSQGRTWRSRIQECTVVMSHGYCDAGRGCRCCDLEARTGHVHWSKGTVTGSVGSVTQVHVKPIISRIGHWHWAATRFAPSILFVRGSNGGERCTQDRNPSKMWAARLVMKQQSARRRD